METAFAEKLLQLLFWQAGEIAQVRGQVHREAADQRAAALAAEAIGPRIVGEADRHPFVAGQHIHRLVEGREELIPLREHCRVVRQYGSLARVIIQPHFAGADEVAQHLVPEHEGGPIVTRKPELVPAGPAAGLQRVGEGRGHDQHLAATEPVFDQGRLVVPIGNENAGGGGQLVEVPVIEDREVVPRHVRLVLAELRQHRMVVRRRRKI